MLLELNDLTTFLIENIDIRIATLDLTSACHIDNLELS
ncbi:MAG: hypothetical protein ACI9UT_001659 [Flavobacteriales bacterium]|jgi:hypothetical protein